MSVETNGTWMPCNETCPSCGSHNTAYDISIVLTSYPEQYHFRCDNCNHYWTGILNTNLGTITPQPQPVIKNGSYGWICPVCGAGVSPHQDHCPVCSRGSLTPTWVCGGGSIASDGTGNYQIYNSTKESNAIETPAIEDHRREP